MEVRLQNLTKIFPSRNKKQPQEVEQLHEEEPVEEHEEVEDYFSVQVTDAPIAHQPQEEQPQEETEVVEEEYVGNLICNCLSP